MSLNGTEWRELRELYILGSATSQKCIKVNSWEDAIVQRGEWLELLLWMVGVWTDT